MSWSGRSGGRRTSWRSRGKHCEAGSERARRPVSRAGRPGLRPGGRDACPAGQPPGGLPDADAEDGRRSGGRPADPVERAIVEVAEANQTDGYRMVAALTRQKLGRPVNRKRVLRVMRERKLIQRRRPLERRKRPGFFRVERPRQLWQLDMTSIWVAEHGWTYLNAIIDCCTREIVAWELELRCRADEAIAVVERAAAAYAIQPGELVLGSDNGSAFTARRFRARLAALGIKHRRGGYRDPESQAFIESWFGKLKEREVWLNEYETLDDARQGIGGYVDRYHHRPALGAGLPDARTRSPGPGRIYPNTKNKRPNLSTPAGSRSPGQAASRVVATGLAYETGGRVEVIDLRGGFLLEKLRSQPDADGVARAAFEFALEANGDYHQCLSLINELSLEDCLERLITVAYAPLANTGRINTLHQFGSAATANAGVPIRLTDLIAAETALVRSEFVQARSLGALSAEAFPKSISAPGSWSSHLGPGCVLPI